MNRKIILSFLGLIIVSGCCVKANSNVVSPVLSEDEQVDYHFREAVSGELSEVDSITNDEETQIKEYTDGVYRYSVHDDESSVFMLNMEEDVSEKLQMQYDSGEKILISQEEAEKKMLDFIPEMFPEYDISMISYECDSETGIDLEFYRFFLTETIEGIRANVAEIDLAYNGDISFAVGSHNSKEKIEEFLINDTGLYNEDNIREIVFEYLLSNQYEIEKNYISEEEPDTSEIVLNEDDAIPDGYKPGDTITQTVLPEYKLYLDSPEDIQHFSAVKVISDDKLRWECSGDIYTSWGEYESLLNTSFSMTIDNTTGEVISLEFTDSDLE